MNKSHLVLVVVILTSYFSCKKFEDGPFISFKNEEKRLEGEWLLKYWTVDGIDSLQFWNSYFGNECKFSFYPWTEDGLYPINIKWGDTCCNYCATGGAHEGISDTYLTYVSILVDTIHSTYFPLQFLNNSLPRSNKKNEWPITRLKYKEVWFEIISNNKTYELHFENITKF